VAVAAEDDSGLKSSITVVDAKDIFPANKKFNVLIRLLDERVATDNNRFFLYNFFV
jgi:hypothetical protein